jgi:hypothetical protein
MVGPYHAADYNMPPILPTKPNQTKPNQTKPNQTKPNNMEQQQQQQQQQHTYYIQQDKN